MQLADDEDASKAVAESAVCENFEQAVELVRMEMTAGI
jgi:hypothetical protein